MSDRTSHRRRARQSSKDKMRAGVDFIDAALANSRSTRPGCCESQHDYGSDVTQ